MANHGKNLKRQLSFQEEDGQREKKHPATNENVTDQAVATFLENRLDFISCNYTTYPARSTQEVFWQGVAKNRDLADLLSLMAVGVRAIVDDKHVVFVRYGLAGNETFIHSHTIYAHQIKGICSNIVHAMKRYGERANVIIVIAKPPNREEPVDCPRNEAMVRSLRTDLSMSRAQLDALPNHQGCKEELAKVESLLNGRNKGDRINYQKVLAEKKREITILQQQVEQQKKEAAALEEKRQRLATSVGRQIEVLHNPDQEILRLKAIIEELKKKPVTPQEEPEGLDQALHDVKDAYAQELQGVKDKHVKELQDAKDQHVKELQDAKDQHVKELQDAKDQHAQEVQNVKERCAQEVQNVKDQHALELQDVKERCTQELPGAKDKNAPELQDVEERCAQELQDAQEKHNRELKDLQERLQASRDKLSELLEEKYQREMKDFIERKKEEQDREKKEFMKF